jgi:hypothetical protein
MKPIGEGSHRFDGGDAPVYGGWDGLHPLGRGEQIGYGELGMPSENATEAQIVRQEVDDLLTPWPELAF